MSETSSSKAASADNNSTPIKLSSNNDNDNFHSGNNNSCKKKKSTAGDDSQHLSAVRRDDGGGAATASYGNDNNNEKPMAGNQFPSEKINKQDGRESSVQTDYISICGIKSWPEYCEANIYSKKSDKDVGEKHSMSGRGTAGDDIKTYSVNHDINKKISLHKGDITKLKADIIVNAANSSLLGGGGVDGAIHKAAGPELRQKCQNLGGCKTGDIVKTEGYRLPAKYIIHTVGPMGEKAEELRSCYQKSLNSLKDERTIAFPCISTGNYGYPNDKAAEVSLETVRKWMEANHEKVDRIIFCIFLQKDVDIYKEKMQKYFPLHETKSAPPPTPTTTPTTPTPPTPAAEAAAAEEDGKEEESVKEGNGEVNAANEEFPVNKDSKKTLVTNQQSYKG